MRALIYEKIANHFGGGHWHVEVYITYKTRRMDTDKESIGVFCIRSK